MNQPSVAASVHPDASRALTNRWPPGPLVMAHLRRDETYAALLPDSRSAPRPSTAACGRRSSCSRRWRRPRPVDQGRARTGPRCTAGPDNPSTSWVTSSSTCTSAPKTSHDAQLIHIREEGVHRAADAADETVTVWSRTGHITVRGTACLLIVSTLFAPQPSVAFRPARPIGVADMLSHVR